METLLRQRASRLTDGKGNDAALLALWASAWFRLHYEGGQRKYDDLSRAIGASLSDAQWRELLEQGLKWWRRPLVERMGQRHRLLTVALEGGFPVRVLAAGEGWLPRYLRGVVGRLLGLAAMPSPEDAFAVADAARDELRDTYRQPAFIALAADLAFVIVELRRQAEAVAPGLTPSTVLDQIRPGWRDELPIWADTDAARRLVDGILAAEKIGRGLSGGAGCVRVLRRTPEGWSSGLRLSLGGEIKAGALSGLARPGARLGVHPHGVLARILGEELAFLDPPGEDEDGWRLRPLTRRTELDNVPLDVPIDVLIQSPDGAARVMPWPGGEPERSDVITFNIDKEDATGPTVLILAAHGSASLRAERVVVTAPEDWTLSWEQTPCDGGPLPIGRTADGRGLWLVDQSVLVKSAEGGLLYCIKTNATEEFRDRIELRGFLVQDFDGADGLSVFAGAPTVSCFKGRTLVKPLDKELLWRRGGGDPWEEWARRRPLAGVIDVMWRDAQTGFVRDRVRAAIVPRSARVRREREAGGWRYEFEGFGELEIAPEPAEGLRIERHSGNSFAFTFFSHPSRQVIFALRMPNAGRSIRIALPFPLPDGIAGWDGRIVPPGSEITPADLGDLVAFGGGKLTLCCELKHAEIGVPARYVSGDQEVGLRPLSERIRSDLASAGIDAWCSLSIIGNSSPPWRVRLFDSEVRCADGVVSIAGIHDTGGGMLVLAGRPVIAPAEEHQLASLDFADFVNRPSVDLPADMDGTWWIYLRSGPVVRSRPSIVSRPGPPPPVSGGLAATALIISASDRHAAIVDRMRAISADLDSAGEDIRWLRDLISSLNGLPASTFDALVALAYAPIVLAHLLLSADEAAQATIWRLESELPFLWAALPLNAWRAAANALGRSIAEPLIKAGWEFAATAALGKQTVDAAASRTGHLDPVVAAALAAANLIPRPRSIPSILDAAQDFVRRTYDRGDLGVSKQTSLFRTSELAAFLPESFATKFDPMHLESLDAPVAAASAAKSGITLTPTQIRRCKEAAAVDPTYYVSAYAAALLNTER
ncbi:hypothetical protein DKG74_20335 [Zavarzinia aquatilis]|uniref:Uncharacterized protein n=1 Tax=Zavarzinia aquatilis TaxID=2211142 RepID=A0A317DY44_9PROT|nr:hypothetical protein DKG74_20335 [Zavarzinia aquatilis]